MYKEILNNMIVSYNLWANDTDKISIKEEGNSLVVTTKNFIFKELQTTGIDDITYRRIFNQLTKSALDKL